MIISDTAVKKSTTVVVLALLLIVIGVYSYMVLPRESDPDVTIPNVFISTSYRGVSPTDIETSITTEIEKKLKGLDGLKKVQSVSSEGLSSINVEFITGLISTRRFRMSRARLTRHLVIFRLIWKKILRFSR